MTDELQPWKAAQLFNINDKKMSYFQYWKQKATLSRLILIGRGGLNTRP